MDMPPCTRITHVAHVAQEMTEEETQQAIQEALDNALGRMAEAHDAAHPDSPGDPDPCDMRIQCQDVTAAVFTVAVDAALPQRDVLEAIQGAFDVPTEVTYMAADGVRRKMGNSATRRVRGMLGEQAVLRVFVRFP